ncbi:O-antigen polysaccharide polymerase Wzy [Leuconostoc mesenteroides]|uniref:O-antigen polysaccharide polymerase Wzy n=1 Tax=Leuconostoc mesenteroides TaxID=1245 RepID=UPI001CBF780F|nr:O-antigen polysaccharide polymerase Wzy [Leuconostoc mesenteroides]MBZ1519476.1 O-antigen polysaccharide polymerase Wzy [Leuconostoc mesenteroides]MBZ1521538.1 O-antigen polysaccharide polymerase Wzy [Leuconostoc mesenteroides]MBZ1523423.1 O-antigen polysaccharide polymerase Wzy [Leuconostoc mesenteroides]
MRIQAKTLLSLIIQIVLIIISFVVLLQQWNIDLNLSFTDVSRYGTFVSIILWMLNIWITGTFFSNISFIFLSFVLFQFGIPILYATSKTYVSWYLSLFSSDIIVSSAVFTIFCIQLFSLGIIFSKFFSNGNQTLIFATKPWVKDDEMVVRAGLLLFLFSATIYFPATMYGAFILHDRFTLPAVGGLAKQLYFPAAFLLLIYTKSKSIKVFIYIMYFAESIGGMMTGGRTEGLLPLMVFIVYFFYYRNAAKDKNLIKFGKIYKRKRNPFRSVGIIMLLLIVLFLLIYIAKERVGETVSSKSLLNQNVYQLFVGELGFNFTTISFVMSGIGTVGYQYGQTYLSDIIMLIPNAIDPTGLISHLQHISGSSWLQENYGSQLGFGLGFSLIGEAFYNFGMYGGFVLFIFGIVVERLQSKSPEESSNWEKYVSLVILLAMLTLPRRDFYQFVKQLEYSVFLVALYLCCFSKLRKNSI